MDKITIINMALSRIGEAPIQSIDSGSNAANVARLNYDLARRSMLREYRWNFAVKIQRLARLAEDGVDYDFVYQLPSGCLKALGLLAPGGGLISGYLIRGGKLYANADEAVLEYIDDVEDTNLFDDNFIEAISYKLASSLAIPITGDETKMQTYLQVAQNLIAQSAANSNRENRDTPEENLYVRSRR